MNAANPKYKMNMAPFKRSAFRRDLRVSLISGFDTVQHADILQPFFEGTCNDVLFVMHFGFITTCKLEDLVRALTLRRMIYEAVRAVEHVMDKKGMRIVYEQLPYPEFDTRKVYEDNMGGDTKRYLAFHASEECKDEIVRVMKYYVKDMFSKEEFVVVRGHFRTPVTSDVLDMTITAMAFLNACCTCGEESYSMRAGVLREENLKRWEV
eukprot:jgi/Tetstr1/421262/TSEL_001135.t1